MPVSITIRHVPDGARDERAARAARSGRSLQEYLRAELVELSGSGAGGGRTIRGLERSRRDARGLALPRAERTGPMKRDPRLVRLSEEHHHGLVFALRLERELPGADAAELAGIYADLVRFWARGLLPHFHAETECLLARLLRHTSPEDERVRRLQRDHLAMEALVARMRDADGDGERREALAAFGETLRTHIRWEERDLFEALQETLSAPELDAAGREIGERLPKPTGTPWAEG